MPDGLKMCADPATEVAAAGCCRPDHVVADSGRAECKYVNEVMSYSKAVERCAARTDGYTQVCPERWHVPGCYTVTTGSWQGTLAEDERSWLNMANVTSCAVKAQVMNNGQGMPPSTPVLACRLLCASAPSALHSSSSLPPSLPPSPTCLKSNLDIHSNPNPRGEHGSVAHSGLGERLPCALAKRSLSEPGGRDVHEWLHCSWTGIMHLRHGSSHCSRLHRHGAPAER